MKNKELSKIFHDFKLFLNAAFDFNRKSRSLLNSEAYDEMDNFMLICFADILGLPIPTTYYTLELLPYLADDMKRWQNRMANRKTLWGEKWGDYDLDA